MRASILLTGFLFLCAALNAQSINDPIFSNNASATSVYFSKISDKQIGLEGSEYLFDQWLTGKIITHSKDELVDFPFKYDLKNKMLEIMVKTEIKVLPAGKVKYFEFTGIDGRKRTFFSAVNFITDAYTDGFFEIIVPSDKLGLYKKTELSIQKAKYIAALDAGNPNDQLVKKDRFYYMKDNKLFKLGYTKKEILTIFGDKKVLVQEFAKKSKVKFRGEANLKQLVEYYNSL